MEERWKPVVGWESHYEVSDRGRVRSLPRRGRKRNRMYGGMVLKSYPCDGGHRHISLSRDCKSKFYKVHRLVLLAFVGPCPDGHECCHNNGIAWDNRLENLRWGTRKENAADSVAHGTYYHGERHHEAKLTDSMVRLIRILRKHAGLSYCEMGRALGVAHSQIRLACQRLSWKHVT